MSPTGQLCRQRSCLVGTGRRLGGHARRARRRVPSFGSCCFRPARPMGFSSGFAWRGTAEQLSPRRLDGRLIQRGGVHLGISSVLPQSFEPRFRRGARSRRLGRDGLGMAGCVGQQSRLAAAPTCGSLPLGTRRSHAAGDDVVAATHDGQLSRGRVVHVPRQQRPGDPGRSQLGRTGVLMWAPHGRSVEWWRA